MTLFCTTCGDEYDESVDICPRDGTPLFAGEVTEAEDIAIEAADESSELFEVTDVDVISEPEPAAPPPLPPLPPSVATLDAPPDDATPPLDSAEVSVELPRRTNKPALAFAAFGLLVVLAVAAAYFLTADFRAPERVPAPTIPTLAIEPAVAVAPSTDAGTTTRDEGDLEDDLELATEASAGVAEHTVGIAKEVLSAREPDAKGTPASEAGSQPRATPRRPRKKPEPATDGWVEVKKKHVEVPVF